VIDTLFENQLRISLILYRILDDADDDDDDDDGSGSDSEPTSTPSEVHLAIIKVI
jgi:hypothetical protein